MIVTVLLAVLFGTGIFAGIFYVTDIEVVGNTLFTKKQITEMCRENTMSFNSLLMSRYNKVIRPDSDFIDYIEVEYIDRNTIRLNVNENTPVGYFDVKGSHYYVDKKGYILSEIAGEDDVKQKSSDNASAAQQTGGEAGKSELSAQQSSESNARGTGKASTASGEDTESAGAAEGSEAASGEGTESAGAAEGSGAASGTDTESAGVSDASGTVSGKSTESADAPGVTDDASDVSGSSGTGSAEKSENTSSKSTSGDEEKKKTSGKTSGGSGNDLYEAAISNLPEIRGIDTDGITLNATITSVDGSVFQTILTLNKLLDKQEIHPEVVDIDEDGGMTLYFGNIRVQLGRDSMLEEKIARAAAILPQLSGMSGVLHLENFDSNTKNIVFENDVKETGDTSSGKDGIPQDKNKDGETSEEQDGSDSSGSDAYSRDEESYGSGYDSYGGSGYDSYGDSDYEGYDGSGEGYDEGQESNYDDSYGSESYDESGYEGY